VRAAAGALPLDPATFEKVDETFGFVSPQKIYPQLKALRNFSRKIAVSKGRAFGRSSHCEPQRSVSERNRRRRQFFG